MELSVKKRKKRKGNQDRERRSRSRCCTALPIGHEQPPFWPERRPLPDCSAQRRRALSTSTPYGSKKHFQHRQLLGVQGGWRFVENDTETKSYTHKGYKRRRFSRGERISSNTKTQRQLPTASTYARSIRIAQMRAKVEKSLRIGQLDSTVSISTHEISLACADMSTHQEKTPPPSQPSS